MEFFFLGDLVSSWQNIMDNPEPRSILIAKRKDWFIFCSTQRATHFGSAWHVHKFLRGIEKMKYILKTIIFILFVTSILTPLWAQPEEYVQFENEVSALESNLENLTSQQQTLNKEINELAHKISELKKKKNLNIFQRRRLEGYLKSSQKLTLKIENVTADMLSIKNELISNRKRLVNCYDIKLKQIINKLENKNLKESQKKQLAANLSSLKQKREQVQANIDLEIHEPIDMDEIGRENGYTARDFKEKADWLKDQEEKLRKNVVEIDHIVNNLQEEIEIREKIYELEQDISIFSHRDEPLANEQTLDTRGATFGEKTDLDISNNAYLEDAINSRSSLLPIFPDISLNKDVSNMSNLNIQDFINELQKRKKQLLNTSDSLKIKADKYYRKAEQAKKIEH